MNEIKKFASLSNEWWNPQGEFALLHSLNTTRTEYIQSCVDLKDKTICDVGCGGGFLTESMARLKGKVKGIDATKEIIQVAKAHLLKSKLEIDYECQTAEGLVQQGCTFDVVTASEVIEHVSNPREFVGNLLKLTKPNGYLFLSTINRTPLSYFGAILVAEYILRWVPKGTHEYEKFKTPSEVSDMIQKQNGIVVDIKGMGYNPIYKKWSLMDETYWGSLSANYILCARKSQVEEDIPS